MVSPIICICLLRGTLRPVWIGPKSCLGKSERGVCVLQQQVPSDAKASIDTTVSNTNLKNTQWIFVCFTSLCKERRKVFSASNRFHIFRKQHSQSDSHTNLNTAKWTQNATHEIYTGGQRSTAEPFRSNLCTGRLEVLRCLQVKLAVLQREPSVWQHK